MTDESIMPFGKHKGAKLANVPADYLLFLHKEGFCRGELKKYIEDNLEVLQEEIRIKKLEKNDRIH